MAAGIDKIDLRILKLLQENGRKTNIQLSGEIGLSPAPTLERVKKLENAGIIKSYHARVDETMVELGIKAWIQISLVRQKSSAITDFVKHISTIEEITECYQVTGNYDYLLKTVVKDIPAFEKLIGEKLSKLPEIGQMHTNVILSEVKRSPLLPLAYEE